MVVHVVYRRRENSWGGGDASMRFVGAAAMSSSPSSGKHQVCLASRTIGSLPLRTPASPSGCPVRASEVAFCVTPCRPSPSPQPRAGVPVGCAVMARRTGRSSPWAMKPWGQRMRRKSTGWYSRPRPPTRRSALPSPASSRMTSSGADNMPKEKVYAAMPKGVEVPLCWCLDPCKLMKSQEMPYTFGRRFFMCANYDEEPPKVGVFRRRERSPPTICDYIQWLDSTQSKEDEEQLMRKVYFRRDYTLKRMHEHEQEEKRKRWQETLRKEKEEAERRAAEAREAERARKREMARCAKEEGEEAHIRRMRKGKYLKGPE